MSISRIPYLAGIELSGRTAKPTTQKELVREFAAGRNLGDISARENLPKGTKGAFDIFEKRRLKELIGNVPQHVTYQEWLSRQSASFQDEVLGKAKGKLFRLGKLPLDRFVDREGRELTLHQLAQLEREAFVRAGLNPEEF